MTLTLVSQSRQRCLLDNVLVSTVATYVGEPDQIAADEDGLSRGDRRT